MSLRSASWWGAFVAGIGARPVRVFAAELGIEEEALLDALVEADPGGPADAAPWWPEASRRLEHTSIRAVARRFGCEPRRIRRALARRGLRVGGEEVEGRGVPALAPFRGRLGREPDERIARESGVSLEGVQGERRRLGIPAYAPTRPVPVEEVPVVREAEPRRWPRPNVEELQVVRRPSRSERAPDATRPREVAPPREPAPIAAPEVARVRPNDGAEPPHRVGRDFFRDERRDDLSRLLQPAARPRDGRMRIVRAEGETPRSPEIRAAGEASRSPVRAPERVHDTPARRSTPAPVANPAPAPARVAPAPPPVSEAPRAVEPVLHAWLVRYPGSDVPLLVRAADAWSAARAASGQLPATMLRAASLELAPGR